MVSKKSESKVPFSAKLGWIIMWIVMLVLLIMVGRNFVASVIYGTSSENEQIVSFYEAGFSDGRSGKKPAASQAKIENPLFIKSYNKGFREGLDVKWREQGQ